MAEKTELPDVGHLKIMTSRRGPALSISVGIVHKLVGEAAAELEKEFTDAITAVAAAHGWAE